MASPRNDYNDYEIFSNAFEKKRQEVVDTLIRQDLKKSSKYKNVSTLLHYAVQNEELEIVRMLLTKKVSPDIKNYDDETPLHIAAALGSDEIIENILISRCFGRHDRRTLNVADSRNFCHLHIVCMIKSSCNILFAEYFLKNGAPVDICVDFNSPQWPGYTPLHFAAENNNYKVAKLLLEHNADVNAQDANGSTPLHIAFMNLHFAMIDLLLSYICEENHPLVQNINPSNNKGLSHFHIACFKNNKNFVKKFLERRADVNGTVNFNALEYSGFTPLHMAVQFHAEEIIETLINHGANLVAKEARGLTPLHLAFKNNSKKVIDMLLDDKLVNIQQNPIDLWGFSHFHIACIRNKISVVKKYLEYGVSINDSIDNESPFFPGYTALHLAVYFERLEISEILLHWKTDVGARQAEGLTPLHIACQQTAEKISHLIQQDIIERTILHSYQLEEKAEVFETWFNNREHHIEIIRLLLNHKSDVNSRDHFDRTPLYLASNIDRNIFDKIEMKIFAIIQSKLEDTRNKMVDVLLEYGANTNLYNIYTGETILCHLIAINESLVFSDKPKAKIVEKLLEKGADVHAKTLIPLIHLAAMKGLTRVAEVLLKHNVDLNTVDPVTHMTPIHYAAQYLYKDTVQMFVENGANVDARERDGKTPLHFLVEDYNFDTNDYKAKYVKEIMECLLKAGCDINAQDNKGKTPLYVACYSLHHLGAYNLLQNGADVNIEDNSGKNPLSCCLFRCRGTFHEIYFYFDDHINKLKRIGCHISKKNETYISRIRTMHNSYFDSNADETLQKQYMKELQVMKQKKIVDISVYDMLIKDIDKVAAYAKNKTFRKIILSKNFKQKFPHFGYLLTLRYTNACTRANLFRKANESLEFLIQMGLPVACTERIFNYLDNKTLNNLIKIKNATDLN